MDKEKLLQNFLNFLHDENYLRLYELEENIVNKFLSEGLSNYERLKIEIHNASGKIKFLEKEKLRIEDEIEEFTTELFFLNRELNEEKKSLMTNKYFNFKVEYIKNVDDLTFEGLVVESDNSNYRVGQKRMFFKNAFI
jgi:hypothetical protein